MRLLFFLLISIFAVVLTVLANTSQEKLTLESAKLLPAKDRCNKAKVIDTNWSMPMYRLLYSACQGLLDKDNKKNTKILHNMYLLNLAHRKYVAYPVQRAAAKYNEKYDVFEVHDSDVSRLLKLFYEGDFKFLKSRIKTEYLNGRLTNTLGVFRNKSQLEKNVERVAPIILSAAYILVKSGYWNTGLCEEPSEKITVKSQKVTRTVNGYGFEVSPRTYTNLEDTYFWVPKRFAGIVYESKLTDVHFEVERQILKIIDFSGGCFSPSLKKMEENMLLFYKTQ